MDTPLTLEQVAEKFKNWRATRTQREKIPDNLLAEVAELKKHHKNSHIARGILSKSQGKFVKKSCDTLLNWIKKASQSFYRYDLGCIERH